MHSFTTLAAVLSVLSATSAHMSLSYPAPFRTAINPFANQNTIDYTPTAPLSATGSNFPCKGYQSDMGTSAGKATASWAAGGQYNFTVTGGAVHNGGSCQAALSDDVGKTWKVIHSYLGSCPLSDGEQFQFTLPSDTPATGSSGTIFAWLWYNEVGNREIYMSCASVDITSGSSSTRSAPAVAYSSRPDLFVANLGNGCTTVEGKEVQFPNPGPAADVTTKYSVADNSGSFTGTCAAVSNIGGEAGSGSSKPSAASGGSSSASSPAASSPTTSQQPTTMSTSVYSIPSLGPSDAPSSTSSGFATVPVSSVASETSSTVAPSSAPAIETSSSPAATSETPSAASSAAASTGTGSSSSGLTVSEDGECSGAHTCTGSPHGPCCSQWGWCGSTDAYCGTGCMAGFGQCGTFVNGSATAAPSAALKKFRIRGGA